MLHTLLAGRENSKSPLTAPLPEGVALHVVIRPSPNAIHASSKAPFVAGSAHEVQDAVSGAIHLGFKRRFTEPFGRRGGSEDRITHRRY
jgi:hypothetical protein